MRLILPSASTTAVFTASVRIGNLNSVAASISTSFNASASAGNQDGLGHFEECAYAKPENNIEANADVGILCSNPSFICVPDLSSPIGGRCALKRDHEESPDHSVNHYLATDERELQTCIKCEGTKACEGLDAGFIDANIGCGSCNGESACEGLSGEHSKMPVASRLHLQRETWKCQLTTPNI